jgi:hypothetical protein
MVLVFTKVDILFVFFELFIFKVDTAPYFLADERHYAFFAQT